MYPNPTMTTILLIEDAIDLAKAIQRDLESEGYQVIHAGDGSAGLEQFERTSPDIIILDWMMPEVDGLEVLRQIRS